MSGAEYVTVIGGANIDIHGFSEKPLLMGDSNPGRIAFSSGGVGRNIAENLARLGTPVKLISVIGGDVFGRRLIQECEAAGVDVSHSLVPRRASSSIYLSLMDSQGEMVLALSDMGSMEKLSPAHLRKKRALIAGSGIIVLDANLSAGALGWMVSNFKGRLFLDPVSVGKAEKVRPFIGSFDTLKLSRLEAEYLSGLSIRGKQSLRRIGAFFIEQGVSRVFITLGKEGLFFHSREEWFFLPAPPVRAVSASGAGDAFMAGIVYGSLHRYDDRKTAQFSAAMAALTVLSAETVSERMSVKAIQRMLKGNGGSRKELSL